MLVEIDVSKTEITFYEYRRTNSCQTIFPDKNYPEWIMNLINGINVNDVLFRLFLLMSPKIDVLLRGTELQFFIGNYKFLSARANAYGHIKPNTMHFMDSHGGHIFAFSRHGQDTSTGFCSQILNLTYPMHPQNLSGTRGIAVSLRGTIFEIERMIRDIQQERMLIMRVP